MYICNNTSAGYDAVIPDKDKQNKEPIVTVIIVVVNIVIVAAVVANVVVTIVVIVTITI